ncbi:MYPU_1760 family metalloprotease [Mycoplasmopsis lipofaciens]|uniref:MYPU_1760 family metalloprotease n=1 Tax=Mycoplasmopsis lipofaciens TaxID=114884 RepID=UPI00047F7CEB|nr:hypothetical protein [Mycoplasmopsis lipofaciens]
MIQPKNIKKNGSLRYKILKSFGIFILPSLSLTSVLSLTSCNFFQLYDWEDIDNKKEKDIKPSINITNEVDNYQLFESDFQNDIYLPYRYLSDVNYRNIDWSFWLQESLFSFEKNNTILVYKDPINNIKFKDFSYGKDKSGNDRFLLDKSGLAFLAYQFYKKVNFGPEIKYLDSININDFQVINNKSNGLYIPLIQQIYLNGSFVAEKGFSILEKVKYLIPTLFHEYMHHWAHSYVNWGNVQGNADNIEFTNYHSGDSVNKETWDKNFIKGFKSNLNYDKIESYTPDHIKRFAKKDFIGNYFSLKNIWDYANTTDLNIYNNLHTNFVKYSNLDNEFSFAPNSRWNINAINDYSISELKYYYSFTELIPREWEKYNFIPYYDYFSDEKIHKGNNGYWIKQDYFGSSYLSDHKTQLPSAYQPNSYNSDWAKTSKIGGYETAINSQIYPNNVWVNNNYFDFYKLFLNSMGYGKIISGIKNKNFYSISEKTHLPSFYNYDNLNSLSFIGYIENKKYDAIVFNINGEYKKTKINYLDYIRFDGKDKMDNKNWNISATKVSNIANNYAAYYTDYIDLPNNLNGTNVGFWQDKNKDEVIQDNEINYDFYEKEVYKKFIINSNFDNLKYRKNDITSYGLKVKKNSLNKYEIELRVVN